MCIGCESQLFQKQKKQKCVLELRSYACYNGTCEVNFSGGCTVGRGDPEKGRICSVWRGGGSERLSEQPCEPGALSLSWEGEGLRS